MYAPGFATFDDYARYWIEHQDPADPKILKYGDYEHPNYHFSERSIGAPNPSVAESAALIAKAKVCPFRGEKLASCGCTVECLAREKGNGKPWGTDGKWGATLSECVECVKGQGSSSVIPEAASDS